MLEKVISGGQTGVDTAGVLAAKKCGLKTGGSMPKGWRTLAGAKPHFKTLFGMREHYNWAYPGRTYANVKDSDGTLRIASDYTTSGEILTKKAIDKYEKPYLDIDPENPKPVEEVLAWLQDNNITTLNVAGNSHLTDPLLGKWAYNYLVSVFEKIGQSGDT